MFVKSPLLSKFGGLSVAVPGEIRGLHAAHSQFGRLPWSRLFEPSIQLANGGWKVTAELDRRIRLFGKGWMENDKDWSPIFAPGGKLLKQGDWIKRANFSYTLSSIANEGPDAFYKATTGGIMTLQDLESYQVVQQPALKSTYQGRHVYTAHAPSSGPVLIHVLNALERFGSGPNVHDQAAMKKEGGLWWHRVTEALKFGSAARTRLGDPSFGNNHKLMAEIPTKEFGSNASGRITDDTTHTPDYYKPIYDVQIDHGTTHTSAADAEGFAIALTSSVNLIWGSRVMDPATGVILNDVMDDFSTPGLPNTFGLWPSPWNYPEVGKRQVSSMAPTIMEHASGKLYLTLGGSGGSRIFGAIAQTILNLDRGMNISGAIEAPRVHDQLFPTVVSIESEFGEREIEGLQQRGHNTSVFDINLGVAEIQAVTLDEDGHIFAASDSRKNGIAAGCLVLTTMASTSAEMPEGRDLTEWQRLEDADDLERQGLAGQRRWKGKSRDTDYSPDVALSSIDEERTQVNGVSKSYPPLSEEAAEERAVMENLKRWENTERLRRKAARESKTYSTSSAPSPITELTRRASLALFRRSTGSTRGSATVLRTESPAPLDDIEQRRHSAQPGRVNTADVARNPFRDPAGAASDVALVTPTTADPFTEASSEGRERSDSTSTITGGVTPVQPVPKRPTLETMGSSFLGGAQGKAHAPTPRPIDLPTTPAPQHVYAGGGTVPARISGPEGMRIRRSVAEVQEEEEELEREKRDGRWWTDWLCGLKERKDPGGQGGRTNPFE
ncbi:hypothetical protein FRC11_004495 [Ceratobasidium sp. 423]|nr:hypothetical protein FRC11_004495 [Ceratobasidium sp. 423]